MNRKKIIIFSIVCALIVVCISIFLIFKPNTNQPEQSTTNKQTEEKSNIQHNENKVIRHDPEMDEGGIY